MRRLIAAFFVVPFAALALAEAPADLARDWPIFRGNSLQTGVAPGKLPDKLEVLWKFQAKEGIEGTAAIVGDTVYFGSFDTNLYAVDFATGKEKWKYQGGAFKAGPGVRDGVVVIGDEDGMVHAVDAKTGVKKWTFETQGEITSGANFAGDYVLIGSHDSTLYALNLADGKMAWKFKTQGPVNGSAVVAGDKTFVAGCDSNLHILDWKSGRSLGQVDLGGQAAATAAVRGDRLFVGTMTNQMLAVDVAKKEVAWAVESKKSQPFYASAAVLDKLVIVGCRDKLVYAFKPEQGDIAWTYAAKGRVDSSPVVVGQRVYFGASDGTLYVIDRDKGTEVQKIELGKSIPAGPAVAQEKLVVGTMDGTLYCLGAKQ